MLSFDKKLFFTRNGQSNNGIFCSKLRLSPEKV